MKKLIIGKNIGSWLSATCFVASMGNALEASIVGPDKYEGDPVVSNGLGLGLLMLCFGFFDMILLIGENRYEKMEKNYYVGGHDVFSKYCNVFHGFVC